MALLATQNINRVGVTPAFAAASAGGDTFVPGTNTHVHVKGATTVTINAPRHPEPNVSYAPLSVAVATESLIGAIPAEIFSDPVTGLVTITCSPTTSVTLGVFELQKP